MTRETKAILNMLEKDELIKDDVLDRHVHRNILDEEEFARTVSDLAFVLEDEVRASARHHFIESSMWAEIVMPYVIEADYTEIATLWLSKIRDRRAASNR